MKFTRVLIGKWRDQTPSADTAIAQTWRSLANDRVPRIRRIPGLAMKYQFEPVAISVDRAGRPHGVKCVCGVCQVCYKREWRRRKDAARQPKRMGRPIGVASRPLYGPELPPGKKVCTGCDKLKLHIEFHKHKGSPDGYNSQCRPCREEYHQRWISKGTRREEARNRNRIRNKTQPERRVLEASIRRSRTLNIPGTHTNAEWFKLCAKFDNRCVCCGASNIKLVRDHVIPVTSKGSSNSIANIQPLCVSCNCRKHVKTIDYRQSPFTGQGIRS